MKLTFAILAVLVAIAHSKAVYKRQTYGDAPVAPVHEATQATDGYASESTWAETETTEAATATTEGYTELEVETTETTDGYGTTGGFSEVTVEEEVTEVTASSDAGYDAQSAPAEPEESAAVETSEASGAEAADGAKPAGAGGALCPVIPLPTQTASCKQYKPVFDNRYCIVNYECDNDARRAASIAFAKKAKASGAADAAPAGPQCEPLNPFENAEKHPESDGGCDMGQPGWERQEGCECDYLVKDRDESGCATSYYAKCTRSGKDAVKCPPFDFPKEKPAPGCKVTGKRNEQGCMESFIDCSFDIEEEVAVEEAQASEPQGGAAGEYGAEVPAPFEVQEAAPAAVESYQEPQAPQAIPAVQPYRRSA